MGRIYPPLLLVMGEESSQLALAMMFILHDTAKRDYLLSAAVTAMPFCSS